MPARARKNETVESEQQSENRETVTEEKSKRKSNTKGGAKKTGAKSTGSKSSSKSGKTATKGGKKSMKVGSKTSKKTGKSSAKKADQRRYFKLIDGKGNTYGRYTGETPKQAASKGFTKMLQKMKKDGEKIPGRRTIYLRESTRGSPRKIYGYEASRQKLNSPQELTIIDKESGVEKVITYRYRNKIKKITVDLEQFGGLAKSAKSKSAKGKSSGKKSSGPSKKVSGKKSTKGPSTVKKGSGSKKASAKKTTTKKSSPKAQNSK